MAEDSNSASTDSQTGGSDPSHKRKPGRRPRWLLWGLGLLASPFLIFAALVAAIALFGFRLDLDFLARELEKDMTAALGRPLVIEGGVSVAASLRPSVTVRGLRLDSLEGPEAPALFSFETAEVQVEILPLLRARQLVVSNLSVDGMTVRVNEELASLADAGENDSSATTQNTTDQNSGEGTAEETQSQDKGPQEPDSLEFEGAGQEGVVAGLTFGLEHLSITDATLSFERKGQAAGRPLHFEEIKGRAPVDDALALSLQGRLGEAPLSAKLAAGHLSDLFQKTDPWPLDLVLESGSVSTTINGHLIDPLTFEQGQLDLSLTSGDIEDLSILLGTALPHFGQIKFRSRIVLEGPLRRLESLELETPHLVASGQAEHLQGRDRPSFSGSLIFSKAEVGAMLDELAAERAEEADPSSPDPAAATDSAAEGQSDPAATTSRGTQIYLQEFPLAWLHSFNLDFDMKTGPITGLALPVESSDLRLRLNQGRLEISPASLQIAETRSQAHIVLDGRASEPAFDLTLTAEGFDAAHLSGLITLSDLEGRLDHFKLQVQGKGNTAPGIIESLTLDMLARNGSLSWGTAQQLIQLEEARLSSAKNQRLRLTANGQYLEEPFSLSLEQSVVDTENLLPDKIRQRLERGEQVLPPQQVLLDFRLAQAKLSAHGTWRRPGSQSGPELLVSGSGQDMSRMALLVEGLELPQTAGSFKAALRLFEKEARLDDLELKVGESHLLGKATYSWRNSDPLLSVDLSSPYLTLADWQFARSGARNTAGSDDDKFTLTTPFLQEPMQLDDIDFSLSMAKVEGLALPFEKVFLKGQVREGRLPDSPFGFSTLQQDFTGVLALDLTGTLPKAHLGLEARDVDLGSVLAQLQVVEGLEAKGDRLSLDIKASGNSVAGLLGRSSIKAAAQGLRLQLRAAGGEDEALWLELPETEATIARAKPLEMHSKAVFRQVPFEISVVSEEPLAELTKIKSLPLRTTVTGSATRAVLKADLPLPLRLVGAHFNSRIEGESLALLGPLVAEELPPLGPYAITAAMDISEQGYHLSDLVAKLGESEMTGKADLRLDGDKPDLALSLTASRLQVDDFIPPPPPPLGEELEKAGAAVLEPKEHAEEDKTLTHDWQAIRDALYLADGFSARLDLDVQKVVSGDETWGQGQLQVRADDRSIDIEKASITLPGGSMDFTLFLADQGEVMEGRLTADADQFDYGILARRIDPDTKQEGTLSIQMDLSSSPPNWQRFLAEANGRVDLGVWPKDLGADVFDIWATNLLIALMPRLDSSPRSHFNCLVGRFDVKDGVMTDNLLVADTTRMTIAANADINFRTEQISLVARPIAKRPQFFSAQTPIKVEGSFSDFSAGVSTGEILVTVVRMASSILSVPLERLFSTSPPPDGSQYCENVFEGRATTELN
ncbi:AsmA family protein [Rhodovibrionaceae bacterium A322]